MSTRLKRSASARGISDVPHSQNSPRLELSPYCDDEASLDCIMNYLADNDVNECEPILIVQYLPTLDTMSGLSAFPDGNARRAAIRAALLSRVGVIDIGNAGCFFHFPSHNTLNLARSNLGDPSHAGNISWAYMESPFTLNEINVTRATVGIAPKIPTKYVNTRMISYYNRSENILHHDYYEFFSS